MARPGSAFDGRAALALRFVLLAVWCTLGAAVLSAAAISLWGAFTTPGGVLRVAGDIPAVFLVFLLAGLTVAVAATPVTVPLAAAGFALIHWLARRRGLAPHRAARIAALGAAIAALAGLPFAPLGGHPQADHRGLALLAAPAVLLATVLAARHLFRPPQPEEAG